MKGFEVSFKVYAGSQEEADVASRAIRQFVDAKARQGIAVTAAKLAEAVSRWHDNYFVNQYFK